MRSLFRLIRLGAVSVAIGYLAMSFLGQGLEPGSETGTQDAQPAAASDGAVRNPPGATQDARGWVYPALQVVTADGETLPLAQIATGGLPNGTRSAPAGLTPFAANDACTVRRPAAGEIIHNVRLESATVDSEVHAFSNVEMAEALRQHLEGLAKTPRHHQVGSKAEARMGVVDVFVTDTSAPVYLVLQAWKIYERQDMIWNIHIAPGVELSHVVMIGDRSGVVLPTGAVTFEALRIGDFIEGMGFEDNEARRPCMVAPFRTPRDDWRAVELASEDNDLQVNHVYYFNTGYRMFNEWYTQAFGVDAGTNLISVAGAAHVLVGPTPTEPIGYRPLSASRVHVTQTDHMVIGDDAWLAVHDETLTRALGGDLTSFDPGPRGAALRPKDRPQPDPSPADFWRDHPKLLSYFASDDLSRHRRAEYYRPLPFEAILKDGEEVPDADLHALYALARAPKELMKLCDEMLAIGLARTCDVFDPRATMSRDGSIIMRGLLYHLPAYDTGNPTAVAYGDFFEIGAPITRDLNIADTPEGRQEVMQIALDACEALRQRIGTCVISLLEFDRPNRHRLRETDEVDASARFALFADRRHYRDKSAKALLLDILKDVSSTN